MKNFIRLQMQGLKAARQDAKKAADLPSLFGLECFLSCSGF